MTTGKFYLATILYYTPKENRIHFHYEIELTRLNPIVHFLSIYGLKLVQDLLTVLFLIFKQFFKKHVFGIRIWCNYKNTKI
jgi:hypothetical protein